jgi:hypothetical protein
MSCLAQISSRTLPTLKNTSSSRLPSYLALRKVYRGCGSQLVSMGDAAPMLSHHLPVPVGTSFVCLSAFFDPLKSTKPAECFKDARLLWAPALGQ